MSQSIRAVTLAVATLTLAGCSSVNFDETLHQVNQDLSGFSTTPLQLVQTDEQRLAQQKKTDALLSETLQQNTAVQLALVNSPALQALLAQSWSNAANAAQVGRIANPSFSLEQSTMLDELEIGRRLSVGLLDILTLPLRKSVAERNLARVRMQLSNNVVDQITQVRQAWVKAVAAKQNQVYAKQVFEAAEASAELAKRMQAVGNLNKLQRARQQSFYADAATQLAIAQHQATASKEALVRALGLTEQQATLIKLPDRLPNLPTQPRSPHEVNQAANTSRLDIQLAQTQLNAAAKAQGLAEITSRVDIELGIRRDTVYDNGAGSSTPRHGYEISLKLPLFDFGGLRHDAMNAQTLAAANQLEATVRNAGSNLRESYSAYRTAWDIANHYRQEVLPLRQLIADETLLQYNGMFIGVFDLLAESRNQISGVMAALAAEQQFWLADAALQAVQIGRPTLATINPSAPDTAAANDAGH